VKVLFNREKIGAELSWDAIAALLPGWEVSACAAGAVTDHLDGVDVLCPFGGRIDAEILKAGTFGLVHQFGVGIEGVDVRTATELGVWVARVPGDVGGNADSCAELAVLDLLALARRLDESRAVVAGRRWTDRPLGRSLVDSTVLIVGLGAIGVAVARRLAPFGPRLLGVRARPELGGPAEMTLVAGPDQLPGLLAQADAVVCCAMLHDGNAGLFGPAEFAAMKPGALFVNVARGKLVDEEALLAALDSGQVGGAGLDVFAREPADPAAPLVRHPRVIATPHAGWHTGYMFRQTGEAFAANLLRYERGERPLWTANDPAFLRAPRPAGPTV
jgi:phosphoglycerate dehydrogenase-like enzyme